MVRNTQKNQVGAKSQADEKFILKVTFVTRTQMYYCKLSSWE